MQHLNIALLMIYLPYVYSFSIKNALSHRKKNMKRISNEDENKMSGI